MLRFLSTFGVIVFDLGSGFCGALLVQHEQFGVTHDFLGKLFSTLIAIMRRISREGVE